MCFLPDTHSLTCLSFCRLSSTSTSVSMGNWPCKAMLCNSTMPCFFRSSRTLTHCMVCIWQMGFKTTYGDDDYGMCVSGATGVSMAEMRYGMSFSATLCLKALLPNLKCTLQGTRQVWILHPNLKSCFTIVIPAVTISPCSS